MWGGRDALRPGGEWKGMIQLLTLHHEHVISVKLQLAIIQQMIFSMQSWEQILLQQAERSGRPLPLPCLCAPQESSCIISCYCCDIGAVQFEAIFPAGGVSPVLAHW